MKRKRTTRSVPRGRHETANSASANGAASSAASSSPATPAELPERRPGFQGREAIRLILELTLRGAWSEDKAVPLAQLCAATQLDADSVEWLGRTFTSSYFAIVEARTDNVNSPVSTRRSLGYYIAVSPSRLWKVAADLRFRAEQLLGRADDLDAAATTIDRCTTPWNGRRIMMGRKAEAGAI